MDPAGSPGPAESAGSAGTPGRAEAAEQIRQAALRYCRGVDRLDADLMKSAYHDDAIDDHGVFVGNAFEFCDRVVGTHQRYAATMHCVLNHAIEFTDDNSATGEIYNVTYLLRRAEDDAQPAGAVPGAVLDTWWGRYVDRYERRDGRWAIAHRTCVHEFTRSEPLGPGMPIDAARFRPGSADRGPATPHASLTY